MIVIIWILERNSSIIDRIRRIPNTVSGIHVEPTTRSPLEPIPDFIHWVQYSVGYYSGRVGSCIGGECDGENDV
ncbi:hypothetical protein HanPSC8_Chr01g0005111 [Helianthus annuus]|nr:hypothetical protein HanPSC8_Chr01g0005111 [Helianthus annuus]